MKKLLLAATTAAMITGAGAASAFEISGNIGVASDYIFRGQSQTGEELSLNGGFDADLGAGFYAGFWGSNVDFGGDEQLETDLYVGYGFDVNEDISLDFSFIQFVYIGEQSALNYQEYVASLSAYGLDLTVVHSPEYLGDGGESFMYYNIGYGFDLPYDISLGLSVGLNDADDMDITFDGSGDDSYTDYSVSLAKEAYGVEWGVTYYDTDIGSDNEAADARVVFSVSKSL